jgi:pSer/pThr/pTyr-binding forkhead associated (FHA) protein
MARLIITSGGTEGKVYELPDVSTIGRLQANEITVIDTKISRRNSKLTRLGDGFIIEDLQSSNGTFVNGSRIKRVRLRNGDEITVGKVTFRFEPGPSKPKAPKPKPKPKAPGPKPVSKVPPAVSVATMETPPAGVEAPAARAVQPRVDARPLPAAVPAAELASMETPPAGIAGQAAEEDVDELVLEGPDEIEPSPVPAPASPMSRPVAAPGPCPGPALSDAPYDLLAGTGAPRKKTSLFSEDVSQRDWRFQWILAAAVICIMALLFFAAFKLSTSL